MMDDPRLRSPRRSNCLVWALAAWAKWGGYLLVRRSHWGPWPHFLWSADLREFWSYVPLHPRRRAMPWHIVWFRGEVREGT